MRARVGKCNRPILQRTVPYHTIHNSEQKFVHFGSESCIVWYDRCIVRFFYCSIDLPYLHTAKPYCTQYAWNKWIYWGSFFYKYNMCHFLSHIFVPVSVWFQLVEISFSRLYRKKCCCIKSLNFFWYVEHILSWYLYSWYIISFRGMYQRWLNDDIPRKLICPFLSAQFSGWLVNSLSYLFSWICLGFSY